MTWVKLDDQFPDHPKVEAAGPLAAWLYVCALCYCAEHLTDGFIPESKALRLAAIPTPAKHLASLVGVGLLERDGHGYRVRSYHEYQPTAEKVKAERKAAADRMQANREKRSSEVRPNKKRSSASPSPSPSVPTEHEVPAVASQTAEDARNLTKAFWESSTPRPAVKFIALVKIVEAFIEAGWSQQQVMRGLRQTRAFTKDAIEYTLRQDAEAKQVPKANRDFLRSVSSQPLELEAGA